MFLMVRSNIENLNLEGFTLQIQEIFIFKFDFVVSIFFVFFAVYFDFSLFIFEYKNQMKTAVS
jgi:hypothetical protein